MGYRNTRIVTEYSCDWCPHTEVRDSLAAPFTTPSGGWKRLAAMMGEGESYAQHREELLCPVCAMVATKALAEARGACGP